MIPRNIGILNPMMNVFMFSDSQGNGRFVSFIRIIKENLYTTMESPNEWIWSDVITWAPDVYNETTHCKNWINKQPDPKLYTGKVLVNVVLNPKKIVERCRTSRIAERAQDSYRRHPACTQLWFEALS